MSQVNAKGTLREERMRDAYNPKGDVENLLQNTEGNILPQDRHTYYSDARLPEMTPDNEIRGVKGLLFSAYSEMPMQDRDWKDKPSSIKAFTAHGSVSRST